MDRELAAALAGELPATAGLKVSDAVKSSVDCPDGVSGARYYLPGGRITVLLAEPDMTLPTWSLVDGGVRATAQSDTGKTVMVVSEPTRPGEQAPFGADIQQVVNDLAQLY